jgi:hypothetical protein
LSFAPLERTVPPLAEGDVEAAGTLEEKIKAWQLFVAKRQRLERVANTLSQPTKHIQVWSNELEVIREHLDLDWTWFDGELQEGQHAALILCMEAERSVAERHTLLLQELAKHKKPKRAAPSKPKPCLKQLPFAICKLKREPWLQRTLETAPVQRKVLDLCSHADATFLGFTCRQLAQALFVDQNRPNGYWVADGATDVFRTWRWSRWGKFCQLLDPNQPPVQLCQFNQVAVPGSDIRLVKHGGIKGCFVQEGEQSVTWLDCTGLRVGVEEEPRSHAEFTFRAPVDPVKIVSSWPIQAVSGQPRGERQRVDLEVERVDGREEA